MKGLVIWVKGATGSRETILDELGAEIRDRGGRVEVFHAEAAGNLGIESDERAKAAACAMLARHGVVVLAGSDETCAARGGDDLVIRETELEELTGDLAQGDFIRRLELAGLVPPPLHDVHPDEEQEILSRLRNLGYLD
jgi:hypothetical protein